MRTFITILWIITMTIFVTKGHYVIAAVEFISFIFGAVGMALAQEE